MLSQLILDVHIFIASVHLTALLLLWNSISPPPFFLCESTANWQPVITTHLPCSAPALRPICCLEHNRGIFFNWPLGNSIYLRSVAAEFALFSIGFGKIGVKTPDKITTVGILLEPGNKRRLWVEAVGPHHEVWDRVSAQVRGVSGVPPLSACKGNRVTHSGD